MERRDAELAFLVMGGSRSGQRIRIPQGTHLIGREAASTIRLMDDGVSRRHALVVRAADSVTIEDSGSTNGTWVNGRRLSSRHWLRAGEEVRIGSVTLRFEGGYPPPAHHAAMPAPDVQGRGSVRLGRVLVFGAVANIVILAVGVAIQFATSSTSIGPWVSAPIVGMVASLIEVTRESFTRGKPSRAGGPVGGERPRARPAAAVRPPKRRTSVVAGVLIAVVLVGSGGAVVAFGVAAVSGYITGNQAGGSERLRDGPVTVNADGVLTTVESVEQTRDFTRVTVVVQNNLGNTITLPLFTNATLSDAVGNTLDADRLRSTWSDQIAPGQTRRGTIVFGGHLPDVKTTAVLSFATVFRQGFDGPTSIVVPELLLDTVG